MGVPVGEHGASAVAGVPAWICAFEASCHERGRGGEGTRRGSRPPSPPSLVEVRRGHGAVRADANDDVGRSSPWPRGPAAVSSTVANWRRRSRRRGSSPESLPERALGAEHHRITDRRWRRRAPARSRTATSFRRFRARRPRGVRCGARTFEPCSRSSTRFGPMTIRRWRPFVVVICRKVSLLASVSASRR